MEGSVRTASGFGLGDGYRSGRCGAGVRNKAQGESREAVERQIEAWRSVETRARAVRSEAGNGGQSRQSGGRGSSLGVGLFQNWVE